MTAARTRAVVLAALLCGAGVIALLLASDHQDSKTVWAIFGPVVGWSFIGVGLYAWRRRPESRTGELMVSSASPGFSPRSPSRMRHCRTRSRSSSAGLWGGVFLQLVMSLPVGPAGARLGPGAGHRRLSDLHRRLDPRDAVRRSARAGVRRLPDQRPAGPTATPTSRAVASASRSLLYVVLFVIVLVRLILRWRRSRLLERLQLTPVYVCGLLTFLLATAAPRRRGRRRGMGRYTATALLPFAFLAGLLRSHVARLDADLRARVEELRASRARLVEAGDTERRRLERNLHDGAQARLVGLAMLLGHRAPARRPGPRGDRRPDRPRAGRAQGQPRRAARARARDPSGGADRARARAGAATPSPRARRCRSRSRPTASSACPAPSRSPRTSSSPRRWPTSPSTPRPPRPRVAVRRTNGPRDRRRRRRRHRRSRRGAGLGPARPRRPGRRARRHAVAGQPAGRGTRLHVEIPCKPA